MSAITTLPTPPTRRTPPRARRTRRIARRPLRGPLARVLAGLPAAPLPTSCLQPMLATLATMPVERDAYAYELKWDGYRALARWDGRRLQLCSRRGLDLAPRFPEVDGLAAALPAPALLDGEVIALDAAGHPSFGALQGRMPESGLSASGLPGRVLYVIFDILHLAGRSTQGLPWRDRRAILDALDLQGPGWWTPPAYDDGTTLLELARAHGLEGVIAKHRGGVYQPGLRSGDWLKLKLAQREEFVIGGYWQGTHGTLGSLLVGYHASERDARAGAPLRYAGRVGTGFDAETRARLRRLLDRHRAPRSPFDRRVPRRATVVWCRPALVAEIAYRAWTHLGTLRHAAFAGLRADKTAEEVVRPDPLDRPPAPG